MFLPAWQKHVFTSLARSLPVLPGAPKWSRWTQGVPTNWPDRVGAVGRGLLRFGAALCAKKPSSRRSENHCIYRKSLECSVAGSGLKSSYPEL